MNTEQPTPPVVVLSTALLERLEDAVGSYWNCAYQDGHLNRPDGDKANAILHEIRCTVRELVAAEREACARVCDAHARGWELNPGANPAAGFIATTNCAADIRTRSNAGVRGA